MDVILPAPRHDDRVGDMSHSGSFPSNFLFGTASSSYQVEGATKEDGRGASIWDSFCLIPGKVLHGHTGDIANDQYHRYEEDVELMRGLGVGAYRFSLAWPRIFPNGYGEKNPLGFDYYHRLIDELLSQGIEPVVTLYHWDLPQRLEDEGGWPSRETAQRFADYAELCFRELGDKVKMWITLNEPFCTSILGYYTGIHAPGRRDMKDAFRAIHHLNLAHGLALESFRDSGQEGIVGTSLNLNTPRPATRSAEDLLSADRAADRDSRMFLDPLFGMGYPKRLLEAYPEIELPILDGDLDLISGKIDFLGLNYYHEQATTYDSRHPEGYRYVQTWHPTTDMGWDIVPSGLYRQLEWVHTRYPSIDLYITENGCAFPDRLTEDGKRCHDFERIDYLRKHFRVCSQAIERGIRLKGYFLWSIIDNFEWSLGYTKRIGIVYCDYSDQRRIPKDSYYYYREVVAGHEELEP